MGAIEIPAASEVDVDTLYADAKYVGTNIELVDLNTFSTASQTSEEIDSLWNSIHAIEAQNDATEATLTQIERQEAIQRGYKKRTELLKLEKLGEMKARQDLLARQSTRNCA